MAGKKLEFSTRLTREDVAGLIEALIEGLKDGLLKVQKSGEVLEMPVPRVVDLEIEAEIDEEHAEFEIEISWRTKAENPDNVPENPAEKKVVKAGSGKMTEEKKRPAAAEKTAPAAEKPGKTAGKAATTAKKAKPAAKKSPTASKKADASAKKAPKGGE